MKSTLDQMVGVIAQLKEQPGAGMAMGVHIEADDTDPVAIIEHLREHSGAEVLNFHGEIPEAEVIVFDLHKRDYLPMHLSGWLQKHMEMNVFGGKPVIFIDKRRLAQYKYDNGRALPNSILNKCINITV